MFLAVLCHSYREVLHQDGARTVLNIPPILAPIKVAILPLLKKDNLPEKSKEIYNKLKNNFNCFYEEKDSIGKRYRRQDALGTPFCVTIDHDTLENNTITLRNRDSMQQTRLSVDELIIELNSVLTF